MAAPAVSIIIATYNRAKLLPRAIRSALAAAAPGDEVIIPDDGSTDNTAQVIAEFGDRIRYSRFPHRGCGPTRNAGVQMATRPLVAFLDSDDEWDLDKLQLQRTFMAQRPDVLFCFSDFRSQLESGETTPNYLINWHHDSRSWDEILGPGENYSSIASLSPNRPDFRVHVGSLYLGAMESDYVATSTVMIRRVEAGAALRFAEDVQVAQDTECFGRLGKAGLAAYFDCNMATQWGHTGERMTGASAYEYFSARITLLERIWGNDSAFVAQYGDRLNLARRALRLKRARWLLVRGRNNEAREDLRAAGTSPLSYRMLAALPGSLARGILGMRRLVRGGAAATSGLFEWITSGGAGV